MILPYSKNYSLLRHIALTSTLFFMAGLGAIFLNCLSATIANNWTHNLEYSQSLTVSNQNQVPNNTKNQDNLEAYFSRFSTAQQIEKQRLREQFNIIKNRAITHLQITIDYYRWLFIAISIASISGVIAGICLFYISKEGWEKANNYVINVFIVCSGLALFTGSLPQIFQQEKNAQDNTKLYLEYINLENEVLTSLALDVNAKFSKISTTETTLQKLIRDTQIKLFELNAITVGFDSNSITNFENIDFLNQLQDKD